jgi:hypothetical protein
MNSQTHAANVRRLRIGAIQTVGLVLVLAIALTGAACSGKKYVLRGQVLSTNPATSEITVKHEEIWLAGWH